MSGIRRGLRSVLRLSLAAALGTSLWACGGDFTGSGDEIRRGEAADLAGLVAEQARRVMVAQVEEAPDPDGGVEISSEVLFSRGAACPAGGSVSVTGSVDRDSPVGDDRLTLNFRASVVHDSCTVRLDGRSVTLVGAPGVNLDALFERRGSTFDGPQVTRLDGRLQWSDASGAGDACAVDLESTLSESGESLTTVGRLCGFEVDRSVEVSTSEAATSPDRS